MLARDGYRLAFVHASSCQWMHPLPDMPLPSLETLAQTSDGFSYAQLCEAYIGTFPLTMGRLDHRRSLAGV